jgi:hypothetical protein
MNSGLLFTDPATTMPKEILVKPVIACHISVTSSYTRSSLIWAGKKKVLYCFGLYDDIVANKDGFGMVICTCRVLYRLWILKGL